MKKYEFEATRQMDGDKTYFAGDTRKLSAIDAAPLVRSGALVPKGKEATEKMTEVLGEAAGNFGVRRVSNAAMDANNRKAAKDGVSPTPAKSGQTARTKDAGNAPRNKADVTTPPPGQVNAGDAGVEPVKVEGDDDGDGEKAKAPAASAAPAKTKKAPAKAKKAAPKKKR